MQLSGDNFPRWELPGGIVWGELSGGSIVLGGSCPGVIVWGAIVRGIIIQGAIVLFPSISRSTFLKLLVLKFMEKKA